MLVQEETYVKATDLDLITYCKALMQCYKHYYRKEMNDTRFQDGEITYQEWQKFCKENSRIKRAIKQASSKAINGEDELREMPKYPISYLEKNEFLETYRLIGLEATAFAYDMSIEDIKAIAFEFITWYN